MKSGATHEQTKTDVKFPKATTRMLTTAEIDNYNGTFVVCTSGHRSKINIT